MQDKRKPSERIKEEIYKHQKSTSWETDAILQYLDDQYEANNSCHFPLKNCNPLANYNPDCRCHTPSPEPVKSGEKYYICPNHGLKDCPCDTKYPFKSEENWEEEFDKLFNGMAPKVSNFGEFSSENAKIALQDILTRWWESADSFYRQPIKDFIKKLLTDKR